MKRHELWWARYNDDVIATGCTHCHRQPLERCIGALGGVTVAHKARITAAGYRWDSKQKELVKL